VLFVFFSLSLSFFIGCKRFFDQKGQMIWTNLGVVSFNQSVLGGVLYRGDVEGAAAFRLTANNVANDADGQVKWAV
jgi:hypothetical protein